MEKVEHNIVKRKLEFPDLLEGPYSYSFCFHNSSYQKKKKSTGRWVGGGMGKVHDGD